MITTAAPVRRPTWRDALTIAAALEALAVAAWLVPASAHVVAWPDASLPHRIAFLPSPRLLAYLTVGVLLASAVVTGLARIRQRDGSGPSLPTIARALQPFLLLSLWTLPFLPWLPDRFPLLLVLGGPLRWLIAGVAFAWSIERSVGDRLRSSATRTRLPSAAWLRRILFAATFILYAGAGMYRVQAVGIDGDEPHYLVIAESLLHDHDLRIENNHRQGNYFKFYGNPLAPHYVIRGRDGIIYSQHNPGLPALVLPMYALAGSRGVVVFIALLGALAARAVFDLAETLAGARAALLTWLAVCLTVPFVPYGWSIFPEMPAALVVAWSALWLHETYAARPVIRPLWTWVLRGAAIGWLPWLHIKFSVLAAALVVALVVALARSFRMQMTRLVAFLAPFGISGALWLTSFFVMYGTFNPAISFGTNPQLAWSYIPHGVIGLLADQKFGLLLYSPAYLFAGYGAWRLLRRPERRGFTVALLASTAVFVLSSSRLYIFWGGSSAPARFLVPILPLLAPLLATAVAEAQGLLARTLFRAWLVVGLAVALVAIVQPQARWLHSEPHGRSQLLLAVQAGSPLTRVVPTFTEPDWPSELPHLAAWLAAAVLGLAVAGAVARARGSSAPRVALAGGLVFCAAGAVLTAAPDDGTRAEVVQRGTLDAIWQFDGSSDIAVDFESFRESFRALPNDRVRELATVPLDLVAAPDAGVATAPVNLPAGTYSVRVRLNTIEQPAREPRELAVSGRRAVLGRAAIASNPSELTSELTPELTIVLPVAVRDIVVALAHTPPSAVDRIALVPRHIVPLHLREPWPVRAIENIQGHDAAYLVYTDPNAYLEGGAFWTSGTKETQVYIYPGGRTHLTVHITMGPEAGNVAVALAGSRQVLRMNGGETRALSIEIDDIADGRALVPLRVGSSVQFNPSRVDPSSTDTRDLGCRVEIALLDD